MGKTRETKRKLQQRIEIIKRINDDPKKAVNDTYEMYLKDLPSTDKLYGNKLGDFFDKRKKKRENKKDIFEDIIELVENFLGVNKKVTDDDRLFSKRKLRNYANESIKITLENSKQIIIDESKKIFFVGDGICGVNRTFSTDSLTISPKEFDFLNILTVEPETSIGQIVYEPVSPNIGKQKTNRELFNAFSNSGYNFTTLNNNTLFNMTWSFPNQHYVISGLLQGGGPNLLKVEDFLNDYFTNIELPDISGITKTAMLLTLQGGEGDNPLFSKSFNDLNRLIEKLFSICGSQQKVDELKSDAVEQFNENDVDIDYYFDFDNTDGIDIDSDDARLRRVLKFVDCDNFEIPIDNTKMDDFIYVSKKKSLNELIENTLEKAAKNAYDRSNRTIPTINFNISLIGSFIKNLPKALIMSLLGPKIFLPIIMIYKLFRNSAFALARDLMRRLSKLFWAIIKRLFWRFMREFWKRVKADLLIFVQKIAAKILRNKLRRYLTIIKSLLRFLRTIMESKIDNCFDLFNSILNVINGALGGGISARIPALLLSFADSSPGYSTDRAYMNIAERLQKAGVELGPLYGESNDLLTVIKSTIEGHTEEEDANGFIAAGNKFFTFPIPGLSGPVTIPPGVIRIFGKKR